MSLSIFNHISELFEVIHSWVLEVISTLGYPGLGLVMFLENVFPPIPSEIILPLAGSLTLEGKFSLLGISLVGMVGSVAGAWVFYGVGYAFDEARVRWLLRRFGKFMLLAESDLDQALAWFHRYGDWVVFFGRMVPVVRSLISIPAGLARMNFLRFTLFTAAGAACWSFVLALAGQILGQSWPLVEQGIQRYEKAILLAAAAAGLAFLFIRVRGLLRARSA